MAYLLEIKPLAATEAIQAYDYYESKEIGLGERFFSEVERLYETILSNPHIFSYVDKPVRQAKLPHFPYVIIYEVEGQKIVVYSVFNTHQDPDKKNPA